MLVTRKIAGHEFSLEYGRRYLASRPMAVRWDDTFDVKVNDTTDGVSFDSEPVAVIRNLSYGAANTLLSDFNSEGSFSGRKW